MRGHWSVVTTRSDAYAAKLGPEGVSGAVFTRDVLSDVDPRDADEIMSLLHRRGIIWLRRNRGAVTVHRSRPSSLKTEPKSSLARVVAAVAPHVYEAALALAQGDRDGVRVSAGRAARLALKHAVTLGLPAVREALWIAFPERPMMAVAYEAPRLQRLSPVETVDVAPEPRKRIPPGLALEEKVFRMIEKAGSRGIGHTELLRGIRPVIDTATLAEVAGQLLASAMIVSGSMRVGLKGKPGTRYFVAEVGLPIVNGRGEAIFAT